MGEDNKSLSKYQSDLGKKLAAAQERVRTGRQVKALKQAAPDFFEIIDLEISLSVNRAFGDKPLPYDDYLTEHGKVAGMRRVRDLLNSKEAEEVAASQEVTAIQETLSSVQNVQK